MTKELWINLPVKGLNEAIDFFTTIGFAFNKNSPGVSPLTAPIQVGSKAITVMLFQEEAFKATCRNEISDTATGTEVLFSFNLASQAEVDELAAKITNAGGNLFAPPAEFQGWMYGCAFADLDGHRWNALYMDMSKIKA
ncbi:VOC family protein [Mucilaginibacter myungsuensis]|uniref:Extradiol dioxygenase n=1 Tax=Mucilaginibacter myungsuensis TaxID=649104 RepID=A0A929KX59_9SPHI|nr:VOC family protein [Mucilaginibacter myungsuensis]MBE9662817.1 extradiol dioxygenase [Mucilaginibacter myungsuensis]MDN3598237.1 extradiol dioxygenase [Mucilaginibacter myungsuensis]